MNNRDHKGRFQKQYLNTAKEFRDRFHVEFSKEERDEFTEMQLFIEQSKDATAIKQLAWLGWFTISNISQFPGSLKGTLFINKRNNDRLGLTVKTELENKFHQKLLKMEEIRREK